MSYKKIFDQCSERMGKLGGEISFEVTAEVTSLRIASVESAIGFEFPSDYRKFLLEIGDECAVWLDFDDLSSPCEFVSLDSIEGDYRNDRKVAEGKLGLHRSSKMTEQIATMKGWIPLIQNGDGTIVVDGKDGSVLYRSFYWDYDPDERWNILLGSSFLGFMSDWARFAFTEPIKGFDQPFEWSRDYFPLVLN